MPGYYNRKQKYIRENKEVIALAVASIIFSAMLGFCFGLWLFTPVGLCETPETYICTTQKGTWVNVRATPDPEGRILGTLRYGYEVESIGSTGGYLQIAFMDGTAFVRQEYFERGFRGRGINTSDSRVVYRAKPNGKKLGHLNPGNWIDILAVTKDADGTEWYRCYGNVYVMARYLEVAMK